MTKSITDWGIRAIDVNSKGEMVARTKGGEIILYKTLINKYRMIFNFLIISYIIWLLLN